MKITPEHSAAVRWYLARYSNRAPKRNARYLLDLFRLAYTPEGQGQRFEVGMRIIVVYEWVAHHRTVGKTGTITRVVERPVLGEQWCEFTLDGIYPPSGSGPAHHLREIDAGLTLDESD